VEEYLLKISVIGQNFGIRIEQINLIKNVINLKALALAIIGLLVLMIVTVLGLWVSTMAMSSATISTIMVLFVV